jgi:type VI secretion system protein
MAQTSLLRRVRLGTALDNRRTTETDLRESVLEHLRVMCSTRVGTMATRPDFGICDLSELLRAYPEAINVMAKSLRHTIDTYEPRLANVRVNHSPSDDLILRFEITGDLLTNRGKSPVRFETTVDTARHLSIR